MSQHGKFSDDGRWWWDGHEWQPTVSQDGRWRWNGQDWVPNWQADPPLGPARVVILIVYVTAGLLTLLIGFLATGLAGPPSKLLEWILPASWLAIGITLIAGGIGLASRRRWGYWVPTVGVILPSAVLPWTFLDESRTRAGPGGTFGVSVTEVPAEDALKFYAAFLACLLVALIAVLFRNRWPRWLATPAAIFMGISCFGLPAGVALITGLALDKQVSTPRERG